MVTKKKVTIKKRPVKRVSKRVSKKRVSRKKPRISLSLLVDVEPCDEGLFEALNMLNDKGMLVAPKELKETLGRQNKFYALLDDKGFDILEGCFIDVKPKVLAQELAKNNPFALFAYEMLATKLPKSKLNKFDRSIYDVAKDKLPRAPDFDIDRVKDRISHRTSRIEEYKKLITELEGNLVEDKKTLARIEKVDKLPPIDFNSFSPYDWFERCYLDERPGPTATDEVWKKSIDDLVQALVD